MKAKIFIQLHQDRFTYSLPKQRAQTSRTTAQALHSSLLGLQCIEAPQASDVIVGFDHIFSAAVKF